MAIRNATLIVTQNVEQQALLRERFDREGRMLPSPIDLDAWDKGAAHPSPLLDRLGLSRFVLWVGRADRFHKRPDLCLQLARALSEVSFLMIMNPSDPEVERSIREAAPPNVSIVESVPFADMPAVLRQAELLVSTGAADYEGAPNVFLQAAASQTPVASLEVPLPVGSDAGFFAERDFEHLVSAVRECWQHPERARQRGARARREVECLHDLPVVTRQFAELLEQVHVPADK